MTWSTPQKPCSRGDPGRRRPFRLHDCTVLIRANQYLFQYGDPPSSALTTSDELPWPVAMTDEVLVDAPHTTAVIASTTTNAAVSSPILRLRFIFLFLPLTTNRFRHAVIPSCRSDAQYEPPQQTGATSKLSLETTELLARTRPPTGESQQYGDMSYTFRFVMLRYSPVR